MPVFQLLYDLSLDVEKVSRDYGPDFRWLRVQGLKASESAPANLTEGFYSQYSTEYLQCLYRTRREGREAMTHLKYARDVGKLNERTTSELLTRYEEGMQQLANLIRSIERKIATRGKAKPRYGEVNEEPGLYALEEEPNPEDVNQLP